VSTSRTWGRKYSLVTVKVPPSGAASFFLLVVCGPNKTSSPCLHRSGLRPSSNLHIRRKPRCQGNPAIEKSQNGIGAQRLPPTTATVPRTKVTPASASRKRARTLKTHTHMQQVARCAHVHMSGGVDESG